MKTTTATTGKLNKTATKREVARLNREIKAAQNELDTLRRRRPDGSYGEEGYGMRPDGTPTRPQQLVDLMARLCEERNRLTGAWMM
jgi:hypothetical protein